MPLLVYNTLARRKEPFIPLLPPHVAIYNCGPTVYGRMHLGNARNIVFAGIVRRWLRRSGYEVVFVQNFTDVDDKIIAKVAESGVSFKEVVEENIANYHKDALALKVSKADCHPRVTEHIPEIIQMIEALVSKGYAYESNGSVYFAIGRHLNYGRLSGNTPDRSDGGAEKREQGDFALWKSAQYCYPCWVSPWGPGRPGWHIECSAMAKKHLGATIDIHMGGSDLIFPHHENELAQSVCANWGQEFVRYWIHNGLVSMPNGQKVSKSAGNGFKVCDLLREYPAGAIRHFLLSSHYRSNIEASDLSLDSSKMAVERLNETVAIARRRLWAEGVEPVPAGQDHPVQELRDSFKAALDDDFNTPEAMGALFRAVSRIRKNDLRADLSHYVTFAEELMEFFGLKESASKAGKDYDTLMELLLAARQRSRDRGDYELSDFIRERLEKAGVELEDGLEGTTWRTR